MTRLLCLSLASAFRRSLLVVAILSASASIVGVAPAAAQKAPSRVVDGTVSLKGGGPVKGAVVHLKDTRALSQRSYITAEDGTYHFAQISGTTDYEVWADLDGKKTPVKSISSFDTKTNFMIALRFND